MALLFCFSSWATFFVSSSSFHLGNGSFVPLESGISPSSQSEWISWFSIPFLLLGDSLIHLSILSAFYVWSSWSFIFFIRWSADNLQPRRCSRCSFLFYFIMSAAITLDNYYSEIKWMSISSQLFCGRVRVVHGWLTHMVCYRLIQKSLKCVLMFSRKDAIGYFWQITYFYPYFLIPAVEIRSISKTRVIKNFL